MPAPAAPAKTAALPTVPAKKPRPRVNVKAWLLTVALAAAVFYGLYVGGMTIYEKVVNSVTVPDFVGMEVTSAQRSASRAGLKAEVVEINHPNISAGTVILQAPEVDNTLRKGDTVVLTVSKGPATQTVPNITGMTVNDGITAAQAYGLTLTVVERVISTDVQADFIINQSPVAGESCKAGDIIQITVSGGSAVVPNLQGKLLTEAQAELSGTGLTMSSAVTYVDTQDASLHGRVAAQSPAADTQVVQGAQVTLSIYRVESMLARSSVTLDLPQSEGLISVRITLVQGDTEVTVSQGEYPANASRHPEVELTAQDAGDYIYKVYFGDKFAYQQQVTLQ